MKKFLMAVAALVAIQTVGCAQVSSDEYIQPGGQYGRSYGIFQRTDTNGLEATINGRRAGTIDKKTFYEDFTEYGDGGLYCTQDDTTACQGAAGSENFIWFPSGNKFIQDSIVAQTIVGGVDMDAASLDIAGDQTENDGLELFWGWGGADGMPFIIGEDPAFYMCAKVTVEDVSGVDDFHFGFRRAGAMNATFDNYLDCASIGPIAGDVTIETILNNGATTTTDTTNNLADGGTDTYCVYVSAAGVVTYTIDGMPPKTTAAFTFDDGDPVIPFIHLLQAATLSGEIDLLEWEVGYQ
jgi:hypothetical protein